MNELTRAIKDYSSGNYEGLVSVALLVNTSLRKSFEEWKHNPTGKNKLKLDIACEDVIKKLKKQYPHQVSFSDSKAADELIDYFEEEQD